MKPIMRDGRVYSYQTVYWINGTFHWYGSNERLTEQEVQHFRTFQSQPPRRSEAAAGFVQRYGGTALLPKDTLQQAMWDVEQQQFDQREGIAS